MLLHWVALGAQNLYWEKEGAFTGEISADMMEGMLKTALREDQINEAEAKTWREDYERIKQDDESVPYMDNGYWYYSRFEEGKEYPIYCRKSGSMDADEEIMLDVNELAEGHDYFAVAGRQVSNNNNILRNTTNLQ